MSKQRRARRYRHPYLNPNLPVEERIDDVIGRMTLEEKIQFLGSGPGARVPRLGLHGINHVEGLHGLALGGPGNWGRPTPIPTTTFCQAIGLGETWDPATVRLAASVEAEEVRYCYQSPKYRRGGLVVRAPNADIGRDIRWGRTEECYGEDAWFNGTMTVAFVKGLQGDHPRYWKTAALMKHFCANSNEDTREHSSSDFDTRLFHEYYSLPFRMGVMEGGSRAYMAAYNCVNGIPCTVHPMLKDITVKQWGQDGIICTDGGALRLLITAHKYYPTLAQGAAWAVKMGINQFLDRQAEPVQEAIAKEYLTEADIDAVIRGNLRVMIRLGVLDPEEMVPYRKIGEGPEPWQSDKHRKIAREVTRKSIVLLKNRGNLLPLDRKGAGAIKSVAVIGLYADRVFLDWYSGTPPYTVSPLEGIRANAGEKIAVKYAPDNQNEAAADLARSCDIAIVVVGNHPTCNAGWMKTLLPSDGKEAVDRKSITLEHEELVKQVYRANPRTIVVLVSSFPYSINWTQENVPAIVHMTHNSQETGNALADVIFGDYNPAGRLVQTWPRSLDHVPDLMNYNIRHGRTYMYFKGEPLYPFGFGLSYTTFSYDGLKVARKLRANASATVRVDVTNTGTRDGEEVVQVYARYMSSTVERPKMQLVAFSRVSIGKGKKRSIALKFAASQLAYYDNVKKTMVVEKGRVQLLVGPSSADLRLTDEIEIV